MKLVYLLGAGRSGTTLLATILNAHPRIQTLGEMHQFLDFAIEDKPCSCGREVSQCSYWGPIISGLGATKEALVELARYAEVCEKHRHIPGLLFRKGLNHRYSTIQAKIFKTIATHTQKPVLLDSSKYLARYLLLSRNREIEIRGIYVVRDVRGLIDSFSKKVQTSRSPLSAIVYYLLINFFGEILYRTDNRIVKIRYEDVMEHPGEYLNRLYAHALDKKAEAIRLPESYDIPHIVGGNRMKTSKQVRILKDERWKTTMPRWQQLIYYFLAFPVMTINRYKL